MTPLVTLYRERDWSVVVCVDSLVNCCPFPFPIWNESPLPSPEALGHQCMPLGILRNFNYASALD